MTPLDVYSVSVSDFLPMNKRLVVASSSSKASKKCSHFSSCPNVRGNVVRPYLAVNNYKFLLCAHCGKPFCVPISRKTSRVKFCKRNSPCVLAPHLNYTHLTCEQAVRNIRQQLARMKKRLYNSHYNSGLEFVRTDGRNIEDFLLKCDEYSSTSVSELKEYYDYLNSEIQERGLKV